MNKLRDFKKYVKRKASVNRYADYGKVTNVRSNGTYDVELLSGEVLTYITPQVLGASFSYDEGMFVSLEKLGGDWQIAGLSSRRGGD